MPIHVRSLIPADKASPTSAPADTVTLAFDERARRRILLTCDGGLEVMLDLAEVAELRDGDRLSLEDGREVAVRAAAERLMEAMARDPLHLARVAWHVGNRHLSAEIREGRLRLKRDHVIADMLRGLGCVVVDLVAPFQPESGAYGHGHGHGGHRH